jgi:hypothetical protein
MNAAGTIVTVECGCTAIEHSSGWASTLTRCYVHGGDPDLSDEYPNLTAQLRKEWEETHR